MIKLITDKTGWQFAVISNDSHGSRWSEEQKRLDYDRSVNVVLKHIKPGDIVIDAGAFIGDYTVSMAKGVGGSGTVLAFEPNLEAYICLAVNCRDCGNVQLHHAALGDTVTCCALVQEVNAGATHIERNNLSGGVRTINLDSLNLERCDFIKADLEGYEPYFIRGAMDTIRKFRPKIFIELNDVALARYSFTKADVLRPLQDSGYRLHFLEEKHNLSYKQIDVFLMP